MKSYRIINLALAIILGLVFLYAALNNPKSSDYKISSSYEYVTGESTISTGLSRSFSSIMRLNLSDARSYNPYGLRLFMFFLIQLIFRVTLVFITARQGFTNYSMLIIADSLQAIVLFVFCFWPFLVYWMQLMSGIISG